MSESFSHRFVELIPKEPDEGVLYVSVQHAIAVHLCACGCGWKVVTPLAPVHWKMTFDGRSVSLSPSIGNHAFPCKSHYWVDKGRVKWSYEMSAREVEEIRAHDRKRRRQFYGEEELEATSSRSAVTISEPANVPETSEPTVEKRPWWRRIFG